METNQENNGLSGWQTRKKAVSAFAVITLTALLVLIFFRPLCALAQRSIPPCMLLTLTGLRCPLCGGTRCARALVRLDIIEALYYNPMIVLTGVFCLVQYARLAVGAFRRKFRPFSVSVGEKGMWIIFAAYFVFFIVRNLALYKMYFY